MLKVLSLGAGAQGTALLLMSIQGELDHLDCAIFADTGWEPAAVYAHLAWLQEQARTAGIPVHRVTSGQLRADALRSQVRGRKTDGVRWASMPLCAGARRRHRNDQSPTRPRHQHVRQGERD